MANRSIFDRGRSADRMPRGMPREPDESGPDRQLDGDERGPEIGFSADRVWNDTHIPGHPNWSPRNMCFMNSPYCT